jgi:hypothetical protein
MYTTQEKLKACYIDIPQREIFELEYPLHPGPDMQGDPNL